MQKNQAVINITSMKRKMRIANMHYVYIVECNDGTLYTGWTVDIQSRIKAHNQGKGAKYTRGRCPVRLKYYETYQEKNKATKREYAIKQMSREKKLKLIHSNKTEIEY